MRVVSAEEFSRMDRPALSWLVEGLMPKPSLVVLVGEPKAGKSFLALQLGLAVAQGGSIWGRQTTQGNVLYLQLDTAELVWRERFQQLQAGGIDIGGPLLMVHPDDCPTVFNILEPANQEFLRRAIAQADPTLVIVDVLRELHNRREDSSGDMKLVGDALMSVTAGRAVLVLHHISKISNKETVRVIDLVRGSSYLAGKADAVWCLIDSHLHLIPRFAETQAVEGTRLPCGFWDFPGLYSDSGK